MGKAIYEDVHYDYQIVPDYPAKKRSIDIVLEEFNKDSLPLNLTKSDYKMASTIGLLSGFVDSFFIGKMSLKKAETWGQDEINQFVLKLAQRDGFKGEDLIFAIRFLEKHVLASDSVSSDFGGGKQHHLRDFSHHFSVLGLICSIYTQFSGKAIGTDVKGNLLVVPVNHELLGKNNVDKLYLGTVEWFFHMASDMAGSTRTPGKGTGIPGPVLSFLKELSVLPFFQNGDSKQLTFRKWISRLFNGTELGVRDANNKLVSQRFDLRTEIGMYIELGKQSFPVLINECLIRSYYFCSRLAGYIKEENIENWANLKKAPFGEILPYNSPSLTRLLTISSGVLSAVDFFDAFVRGAIETYLKDNKKGIYEIVFRINYPGIGRFLISSYIDTQNTVRRKKAIKDQISKDITYRVDLKPFQLTAQQLRLYWSILDNAISQDIDSTKNLSERMQKEKWREYWKNITLDKLGLPRSEADIFFYSYDELQTRLKQEIRKTDNNYWLYSIAIELLYFEPYSIFDKKDEKEFKGLATGKNYLLEQYKVFFESDASITKVIEKIIAQKKEVHKALRDNKKIIRKATGTIVLSITAGGIAYVFAPVIAPAIVGVISEGTVAGLYGAALTSKSLAYLGFGSIASGGFGMAGGTAMISSGGALLTFLGGSGVTAQTVWSQKKLNQYFQIEAEKLLLFIEVAYSCHNDRDELNRLLTEVKHAENNVMELIRKPEKLIEPSLSLKEQNKKREIINGNLNYVKDLLFKCRCRLEVKLRLVEMKENRQKQSSGQST